MTWKVKDLEKLRDYGFKAPITEKEAAEEWEDWQDAYWISLDWNYCIGHARRGQFYYLTVSKSGILSVKATAPDGDGSSVVLPDILFDMVRDGIVVKEEPEDDKFDELYEALVDIDMSEMYYYEDLLEHEIWKKFPDVKPTVVAGGLDVDTRRWYETSTTVVKVYNSYLGIRHVSNVFSEAMSYSDCDESIKIRPVKPVTAITYK